MNLWKEKASWVLCKGEQKKDSRVSFGQRKNRKYPCALIAAAIMICAYYVRDVAKRRVMT